MASIPADTVVVPLASENDAELTCSALVEYLDPDADVVLVYVAEKGAGAPDKTSPEHSEEYAETIFAVARGHLDTNDRHFETRVLYGTDVANTVFDAATDVGADLVVFSPREASRLARFLSGDVALDLITDPTVPVLVVPKPEFDDQE